MLTDDEDTEEIIERVAALDIGKAELGRVLGYEVTLEPAAWAPVTPSPAQPDTPLSRQSRSPVPTPFRIGAESPTQRERSWPLTFFNAVVDTPQSLASEGWWCGFGVG
ncbi:MAG: hypothetical protein GEV28_12255, partial [Actinophytocola sp.]|uniref:hypothetical protein n=1 Tax=Actinophytocola sp. TaxID=1872138 RepID=UPI001321A6CB